MIVRATARCLKSCVLEFHVREAASFSDDKVGCLRRIVSSIWMYTVKLRKEYITLK